MKSIDQFEVPVSAILNVEGRNCKERKRHVRGEGTVLGGVVSLVGSSFLFAYMAFLVGKLEAGDFDSIRIFEGNT